MDRGGEGGGEEGRGAAGVVPNVSYLKYSPVYNIFPMNQQTLQNLGGGGIPSGIGYK